MKQNVRIAQKQTDDQGNSWSKEHIHIVGS